MKQFIIGVGMAKKAFFERFASPQIKIHLLSLFLLCYNINIVLVKQINLAIFAQYRHKVKVYYIM